MEKYKFLINGTKDDRGKEIIIELEINPDETIFEIKKKIKKEMKKMGFIIEN